MFEFRFHTLLKAMLALACVLGGCEYLSRLNKLKAELAEVKDLAGQAREAAEQREKEWSEIKRAKDKLDELAKRESELLKHQDLLDQKERRLTGEIKYLSASMTTAVENARTAAVGSLIPELRLHGRSTLRNAKILKITNDSITFLHEDGVANLSVTAEELPADLVQKDDLGPNSIFKGLQRLEKDIL